MARYHVNKATGEVGPCRARKRCPFGDLQEEHYGSPQEAEAAFAKLMEAEARAAASGGEGTWGSRLLSPQKLSREEEAAFAQESQALAQELAHALMGSEGPYRLLPAPVTSHKPLDWDGSFEEKPLSTAPAFALLGAGGESIVYHHRESGLVFKVPHEESINVEEARLFGTGSHPWQEAERFQQEAYGRVESEALASHGVRQLPTYFLSVPAPEGDPLPVQVQAYLPPEAFEAVAITDYQVQLLVGEDTHHGNVRREKATGLLYLID